MADAESAPARRRCPVCEQSTLARICPQDQIATLLEDPPEATPGTLQRGSVVAERYLLQRRIGGGAYAAVFEARHMGTGQNVALKILSKGPGRDGAVAARRFFLEARVCSGLKHPNTVRVFDFGQDDGGLLFIAMELLVGRSLREEIAARRRERRPFTEVEAMTIGVAVLKSLHEAHKAGLVHRDLKPENVFLHQVEDEDLQVKVLDFGVVRETANPVRLTEAASVVGTPAYMSPEQVLDRPLDARSDLYALGLVLFELVSLARPFGGQTALEIAHARLREAPRPLAEAAQVPLSPEFTEVVGRVLAREPSGRFKDALEMRGALERIRPSVFASAGLSLLPGNDPTRVAVLPPGRASSVAPVVSADLLPISDPIDAPPPRAGALAAEEETQAADGPPLSPAPRRRADSAGIVVRAAAPAPTILADRTGKEAPLERGAGRARVGGPPTETLLAPRAGGDPGPTVLRPGQVAPTLLAQRTVSGEAPGPLAHLDASAPLSAPRQRGRWIAAAAGALLLGAIWALGRVDSRAETSAPAPPEAAETPPARTSTETAAAAPSPGAPTSTRVEAQGVPAEDLQGAPAAAPSPEEARPTRRPARRAEPRKAAPNKRVQEMLDLRI